MPAPAAPNTDPKGTPNPDTGAGDELPEDQRPTISKAQLEAARAAARAEAERKAARATREALLKDDTFLQELLTTRGIQLPDPEAQKGEAEAELAKRVNAAKSEVERKAAAELARIQAEAEQAKTLNQRLLSKSKADAIKAAAASAGFLPGIVERAHSMFGDLVDFNAETGEFAARDGEGWAYGADGKPKSVKALLADLALSKEYKDLVQPANQQGTTAAPGRNAQGKLIIRTQAEFLANLDKVQRGEAIVDFQ